MNKIFLSLTLSSLFLLSCNSTSSEPKKAEYSGIDMTNTATLVRDKQTKKASLQIDTNDSWSLYAGTSVDSINFSEPLLIGQGSGLFPINVSDSVRYYFQLVTNNGTAILSDKHLPMTGGYNFRDMGGIRNTDGKYVKWGKIFRSDDLHKLTDNDLKYLESIPLISIVDFRSQQEMELAPDKIPSTVVEDYLLSIAPGNLLAAINFENIDVLQLENTMMDMNRLFVTDSLCIQQYKSFFELIQDEKNMPLMFHCSAGKDRTGMGAALFLSALGVDEETIFEDYLSSNTFLADKYSQYITEKPNLKPFFEVKREYLKAGIDQMKKDYGTVQNYLIKVLNVDITKMKEMYLY